MLQLSNESPFEVEMFGFPDVEGVDTLYVAVKGTFSLEAGQLRVAEEQLPVTLADEYVGEPQTSSLRYASDAHLGKLGTDVVVIGDACAPGGRPREYVDVSVAIAGRTKSARVHGDRYWTGGMSPSRPKWFVRMPVAYERTFGGLHVPESESGVPRGEARNPVGCGYWAQRSTTQLLGQPVPNVEDLRWPVRAPGTRGTPVGFGPIAPSWEPRRRFAGTYDEAWEQTRAPYLPRDFDLRFFNVAPPDQVFERGLFGGEPVTLLGFHPCGGQHFNLPTCELSVVVMVGGEQRPLQPRLETVSLEPTEERLSLIWRASLPVDKKMLKVEEVGVSLLRIDGVGQGKVCA